MEKEQFDQERERLHGLGLDIRIAKFGKFGWHSIHFHDPDGNSVAFVCYDPSVLDMEGK
jgi:hypothetical protein